MQRISLSEAFVRRFEIEEKGQAIYFQGDDDDEYFEINFLEKSARRPGWYLVTMKRDDDQSTAFNLPGQIKVLVK